MLYSVSNRLLFHYSQAGLVLHGPEVETIVPIKIISKSELVLPNYTEWAVGCLALEVVLGLVMTVYQPMVIGFVTFSY